MKKGDIRNMEILSTAETLFCKKGYEQTSIQDILDVLRSSKGSFYHHYPSKESLLAGICKKRAEQVYAVAEKQMDHTNNIVSRLNILFSGMIPLCNEKLSFLLMFLPIYHLPEGRSVRQSYSDSLAQQVRGEVIRQVQSGLQEGILFCTDPETSSDIILLLLNHYWMQICDMIVSAEEEKRETELSDLLFLTDQYRINIEKILSLPFGSLSLTDIPTLRVLNEQIHNHWNL